MNLIMNDLGMSMNIRQLDALLQYVYTIMVLVYKMKKMIKLLMHGRGI